LPKVIHEYRKLEWVVTLVNESKEDVPLNPNGCIDLSISNTKRTSMSWTRDGRSVLKAGESISQNVRVSVVGDEGDEVTLLWRFQPK
jgi:hypothetical protein